MSQFFYKRTEKKDPKVEGSEDRVVMDCFNTDKVIRGVWFGKVFMVLLDDGHENSEQVGPASYNKNGVMVKDAPRAKIWRQSEIELDEEDALRFRQSQDYSFYGMTEMHSEGENDSKVIIEPSKQEEKAIL